MSRRAITRNEAIYLNISNSLTQWLTGVYGENSYEIEPTLSGRIFKRINGLKFKVKYNGDEFDGGFQYTCDDSNWEKVLHAYKREVLGKTKAKYLNEIRGKLSEQDLPILKEAVETKKYLLNTQIDEWYSSNLEKAKEDMQSATDELNDIQKLEEIISAS